MLTSLVSRAVRDRWRLTAVALALVLVALNAVWLWVNRHGGSLGIDEAGYTALSVDDYHALIHGGPVSLARLVLQQRVQAPLVPILSAAGYTVTGGPTMLGSFIVDLVAYFLIALLAFSIVRALAGPLAGIVAAVTTASAPVILDYVHEYSFAIPATAAMTLGVWAALRSKEMSALRWTVVWGVALGLMVLSRTMTIAFVPGFVLLATVHAGISRRRTRSLAGAGIGAAAGALVSGPWYVAQGASVWGYLTSYGYGNESAFYGSARSVLSIASWGEFLRANVNSYIWLPLAMVLLAGVIVLVVRVAVAARSGELWHPRRVLGSPWFYLSLVAAEGAIALGSSRNTGLAFSAPLVPVVVCLCIGALFRWTVRRATLVVVTTLAFAVAGLAWFAKTALNGPAGSAVAVNLPGIGEITVLDGRSAFDVYVLDIYDPSDPAGKRWVAANQALVNRADSLIRPASGTPVVIFAANQRLLNQNTFRLNQLAGGGVTFPTDALSGLQGNDLVHYVTRLRSLTASHDAILMLRLDRKGALTPRYDPHAALRAAEQLRFHEATAVRLPDGSQMGIWRR